MHVVITETPTVVEYLPLPQSVQAWFPCVALYFPASHAIDVPPLGPVYPTTHRQLVERLLPLREIEFSGQESLIMVSLIGQPQPSGKRAGGQRRRVDGHEGPRSLLTHTTVKRDLFYEGRSRDGGRSRVAAGGRQMTNKVERF